MKLPRKRTLLYFSVGALAICVACVWGGIRYFTNQFFREHPNALSIQGDLHPIPFQWASQKYEDYKESHNGILFKVNVPGVEKQLYMQFDTGSPSTFLRSGCLESLAERGVQFTVVEGERSSRVQHFELDIGGNRVVLDDGWVMQRDIPIDWNPDAVSIIGSIGADFLADRIVSIDFAAQEIELFRERSDELDSLGTFIPFRFPGRRVMLPAQIAGDDLELLWDSGCSPFGLLTSKYHFDRLTKSNAESIQIDANRFGDAVPVHHRACESNVTFGEQTLALDRVSYVELYAGMQSTFGRFVNGGFMGNKFLLESKLILDGVAGEFLIVPSTEPPSQTLSAIEEDRSAETWSTSFQLTEANNIAIKAVLNEESPLTLMFHTGNSAVCLTKKATSRLANLDFNQQANIKSWGGKGEARISTGNSLQIAGRTWKELMILEDLHSGPGTDGKFGPDLFDGQVLELDFENKRLVAHNSLPNTAGCDQLNCRIDRSSIFIQGTLEVEGRQFENEFMLHSGYGGTVLLDDEFVRQNSMNDLEPISESELRDSLGNVLKTKKVQFSTFSLGKAQLDDIPISFFNGAIGRQKMSVLGGEILKRFNVILDLDNNHVYLKPNSMFDTAFPT